MRKKINKYHNRKVLYEGIKFDSKKEAIRYKELKLLEKTHEIAGLSLQPRYELIPKYTDNKGDHIRAVTYIADFTYYDNQLKKQIIEDVKGMQTDVYKIKKKLLEYKLKDNPNVIFKEIK